MSVLHTKVSAVGATPSTTDVDGVDWNTDHRHVPFEVAMLLANGNTPHVGPGSAAANAELFSTSKPTRNIVDLATATQVRMVAMVTALGSSATAAIKLSYTTSADTATWAGADAVTGGSLVLGNGTAGVLRDTGWQTLVAGARVDNCRIAALVASAFGTTGPSLGSLTVFFR